MNQHPSSRLGRLIRKTNWVLFAVTVAFGGLVAALLANAWGRPEARPPIPLVDPAFLDTAPSRQSYADLVQAKEDLSDYACYVCHERDKPPPVQLDAQQKIIIPDEHSNIAMAHGDHNRNNLCYNCHNETNLEALHIRDGQDLKFSESPRLCGSCHGPTYRDWEAGAHGRTSGFWDRSKGGITRLACVNCHDPHAPRIPSRPPAPAPHPLHAPAKSAHSP